MADVFDFKQALERMRQEFMDGCEDRLERLDNLLKALGANPKNPTEYLLDLQREVHSLKGTAGTFGFKAMGQVAHSFEDFIEANAEKVSSSVSGFQIYVDRLRDLADLGSEPQDSRLEALLKGLPSTASSKNPAWKDAVAVLVMASGIQRKIVASDLQELGLRVSNANNGLEAIGVCLARRPELVVVSMELSDMTGLELAQALQAFKKMAETKYIIATAGNAQTIKATPLPKGTEMIQKGDSFRNELGACLARLRS